MIGPKSGSGEGVPVGKSPTAGSATGTGSGTGTGADSCEELYEEPSAKGEPLSSPACASSLLSTHSFARYRKNTWERFDDIVTPEEPYGIVWQCHDFVEQSLPTGQSETSGQNGTSEAHTLTESGSAPSKHGCLEGNGYLASSEKPAEPGEQRWHGSPGHQGHLAQPKYHTRSGEAVLWAYPNDIEPLVVGHVLLDLCPSEQALSRKVHLTVKERGSVEEAPSSGASFENLAGKLPRISSGLLFGASPEKTYHVTIGSSVKGAMPLPPLRWMPKDVLEAMDAFIEAEGLWESTGCFHRAGVYAMQSGAFLARVEDIGRHNCVDRLAGWSVLNGIPLSDKALLVSARMTSSLCAKAIRAGFPVIVSRSAVTTAAIAMAREAGVTLIGFARTQEQRFTVFSQGKCGIYDE